MGGRPLNKVLDPMPAVDASAEIRELGQVAQLLISRGFRVTRVLPISESSFGNFAVDFSNGPANIQVTRDRGQFIFDGDRKALEAAGLWRAFHSPDSALTPLTAWLSDHGV